MKRLLIVLTILALATTSFSFEAIGQLGGGMILQQGQGGQFGIMAGFDAPVITREGNYVVVASVTYIYADRGFDAVDEIQAERVMVVGKKFLGLSSWYIGMGGGTWLLTNTSGEDVKPGAFRLETGITIYGFDVNAGVDVVSILGEPDIYYPALSLSLTGF